jgi:hypothetical protein
LLGVALPATGTIGLATGDVEIDAHAFRDGADSLGDISVVF